MVIKKFVSTKNLILKHMHAGISIVMCLQVYAAILKQVYTPWYNNDNK